MIPIVILASGRGSNLEAIYDSIQSQQLDAKIAAVISDQPNALALLKAREFGIRSISIPFPGKQTGLSLEERRFKHESEILQYCEEIQPRFLVLAGYMRILTRHFIESFRCDKGYTRMVNIHPSLLPAFPGIRAYAQAFQYGVKFAGVTIHLVEPEMDSGPICAQEVFSIADCQSELEVEQRGLAVEHRLYPQALNWILSERFVLERRAEGRFCVCPN
jgi:phosphoribosylglycinamide formyltransferase 1